MIYRKRLHRKPDPLILLMVFVLLGLSATISYQIIALTQADRGEIAVQPTPAAPMGG